MSDTLFGITREQAREACKKRSYNYFRESAWDRAVAAAESTDTKFDLVGMKLRGSHTYQIREELKRAGFVWDKSKGWWVCERANNFSEALSIMFDMEVFAAMGLDLESSWH